MRRDSTDLVSCDSHVAMDDEAVVGARGEDGVVPGESSNSSGMSRHRADAFQLRACRESACDPACFGCEEDQAHLDGVVDVYLAKLGSDSELASLRTKSVSLEPPSLELGARLTLPIQPRLVTESGGE